MLATRSSWRCLRSFSFQIDTRETVFDVHYFLNLGHEALRFIAVAFHGSVNLNDY
jgi:hypothetical protein